MDRNSGISLLRVCSMFMIVLCHYSNYIGISWLAQFLNVGVYIFLLISGWLYSRKIISEPKGWLLSRWKKLCVPVLTWMVIVIVYAIIVENEWPLISDVILFVTNLQGLSWILLFFPKIHSTGVLGGLGNLWFVTAIMLCYVILILVKEIENKSVRKNHWTFGVASVICFVILGFCKINLAYFICFLIGYALGKREHSLPAKPYMILSTGMIAAVILRLLSRHYFDGTVLYDVIVVGITHTMIAIWIFFTVRLLEEKVTGIHTLAASKAIEICDAMSYYVYITHNYFLVKQFGLEKMVPGIVPQTMLFCLLSLVTALIVRTISEWIIQSLLGGAKKHERIWKKAERFK